jgi:hypothetical protein
VLGVIEREAVILLKLIYPADSEVSRALLALVADLPVQG